MPKEKEWKPHKFEHKIDYHEQRQIYIDAEFAKALGHNYKLPECVFPITKKVRKSYTMPRSERPSVSKRQLTAKTNSMSAINKLSRDVSMSSTISPRSQSANQLYHPYHSNRNSPYTAVSPINTTNPVNTSQQSLNFMPNYMAPNYQLAAPKPGMIESRQYNAPSSFVNMRRHSERQFNDLDIQYQQSCQQSWSQPRFYPQNYGNNSNVFLTPSQSSKNSSQFGSNSNLPSDYQSHWDPYQPPVYSMNSMSLSNQQTLFHSPNSMTDSYQCSPIQCSPMQNSNQSSPMAPIAQQRQYSTDSIASIPPAILVNGLEDRDFDEISDTIFDEIWRDIFEVVNE